MIYLHGYNALNGQKVELQKLRILSAKITNPSILPVFRPIFWHVKIVFFTSNLYSGVLYTIIFHIQPMCKTITYRWPLVCYVLRV